jgi:hypothetical protein
LRLPADDKPGPGRRVLLRVFFSKGKPKPGPWSRFGVSSGALINQWSGRALFPKERARPKSHKPYGLRWFSVEYLVSIPPPTPPLWGPEPSDREASQDLITPFWPSRCPSFLHRFDNAVFNPFGLDFPPQLGTEKPPKSIKNRCRDAFHLGLDVWIDFCWILLQTWTPETS